jgi:hypothetical protein
LCLSGFGCIGVISTPASSSTSSTAIPSTPAEGHETPPHVPAIRRLTRSEVDLSLSQIFGRSLKFAANRLPEDLGGIENPFFNDRFRQVPQEGDLAEGAASLASDVASSLFVAGQGGLPAAALAGCTPKAANDTACLKTFAQRVGRLLFRRSLNDAEATYLAGLSSIGSQLATFEAGARAVVRCLIAHPEFLYRVEMGTEVPGAEGKFQLSSVEMASKLSFTLTGASPPSWLLDLADSGSLDSVEGRKDAAIRLLTSPLANERIRRFHAEWLGFGGLSEGSQPFLDETYALVDAVTKDGADHHRLLTEAQTFVTPAVAAHYGLAAPANANASWVSYPNSRRGGVLSHATFLSVQPSGGEDSPTRRGRWVQMRLLCVGIGEVPAGVPVAGPPEGVCRKTYMTTMHAAGGCQSCHKMMDPVGFGLERFGLDGKERSTEPGKANCALSGDGEITDVGAFNGPGELGRLLSKTERFDTCLVRHALRFAEGRFDEGEYDSPVVTSVAKAYVDSGHDFRAMLVSLVSHPQFSTRSQQ